MNGEATSSSEDAPWVSAMVGGKGSRPMRLRLELPSKVFQNGYRQYLYSQKKKWILHKDFDKRQKQEGSSQALKVPQ